MSRYTEFTRFRQDMNKIILEEGTLEIKRFFALDERTYQAGALDAKTKELLGLSASLVLRCDDCISYHIIQAKEQGASDVELYETFSVGLIVGGSIVIPHLRRAVQLLGELKEKEAAGKESV